MTDLSMAEIRDRVEALKPWFHDLDLAGVSTAPEHFLWGYPRSKFQHFAHVLPDVTGMTVLDIGCNAGFYALEMKRRGAARVLGIDSDPRYLAQARLASEVSGLDIELRQLSVYDVAKLGERFDLVIFMGVLYHLRHPLLALDLIREHVTGDLMLFQTLQRGSERRLTVAADYAFGDSAHFSHPGYPKLHFIEHHYAGDPTNWWAPNGAASEAMLRSAGFAITAHPEPEVYLCRAAERRQGDGAVYPATGAEP